MHRGLIVGISDYGRLKQSLPGSLNDMNGWRELVAAWGVSPNEIRTLSDSGATRGAMLEGIKWLLTDAGPGDERLFFFAGHGARVRRRDPEPGTLQDKLDETLVAYPGEQGDLQDFMIFDEDLAALVDASEFPREANLTFIFDSCHSGGMLRDILSQVKDAPLPRCLVIPEDMVARTFEFAPLEVRSIGALEKSALNVPRLIIAAAKAEQSAWDAEMPDGRRHGVFSYYAQEELSKNSRLTPKQIVYLVGPQVGAKFPQTPILLGAEETFDRPFGHIGRR